MKEDTDNDQVEVPSSHLEHLLATVDKTTSEDLFDWGDVSLKEEIELEKELEKQKRKEFRQKLLRKITKTAHKPFAKLTFFKNKSPKVLVGSLAAVSSMLVLALVLVFSAHNASNRLKEQTGQTLPANFVKESSQEKLYYPTKLPAGYRIDTAESVNEDTLVAYTLTNSVEKITLSQQTDVPNTSFETLFSGSESIETETGTAYIKSLNSGETVAAIQIGSSTIFLNTKAVVDNDTIKLIFDNLDAL